MPARRKRKNSQPVKKTTQGVIDLTRDVTEIVDLTGENSKRLKDAVEDPALRELLDQASFHIHLKAKQPLVPLLLTESNVETNASADGDEWYSLGEFKIEVKNEGRQLPDVLEYWLYVAESAENGSHFLYQEQNNMLKQYSLVEFSSSPMPHLLSRLALGMSGHFRRNAVNLLYARDNGGRYLDVEVLIDNRNIVNLDDLTSVTRIHNKTLTSIQAAFYLTQPSSGWPPITTGDSEQLVEPQVPMIPSLRHDLHSLYAAVKYKPYLTHDGAGSSDLNVEQDEAGGSDLPTLTTTTRGLLLQKLRPYQLEAVKWMITKEKGVYTQAYADDIQGLFSPVPHSDLYINSESGVVSLRLPHLSHPPGGILADEMGLGKTVEVLACMVCHPRKDIPISRALPVGKCVVIENTTKHFSSKENVDHSVIEARDTVCHNQPGHGGKLETVMEHDDQSETVTEHDDESETLTEHSDQSETGSAITELSTKSEAALILKAHDGSNGSTAKPPPHRIPAWQRSPICRGFGGPASDNNSTTTTATTATSTTTATTATSTIPNNTATSTTTPARFECTCGGAVNQTVRVQCSVCSLQQHAGCVGYDIADPYRGEYKCPHCHFISEPIKSAATLIVAPSSIRHQWKEEIIKHVGSANLKVLEYGGISSKSYIQPMTLARQDIVITTYEVLRQELRSTTVPHSNSDVGRQFRNPKRFMALPSPITAVEWWRVCLDEAQMVESVTTATAEMALKLSAVNRWCVTGTPINTGVSDLYGLFTFLGIKPFYNKVVWNGFLYRPYCFGFPDNLLTVLRHVMWRTCKADVKDQLGLPSQTELIHQVVFSPVEEVFYRQQYTDCKARFLRVFSRWGGTETLKQTRLDTLSRSDLSQVLYSLLDMRKACCYPEKIADKTTGTHTATLTMSELLAQITKKTNIQCEDAHRAIVAALNGQAACHVIKEEYDKAIEKYLEVLKPPVTEHGAVRTDPLQLIHATHNLREILLVRTTSKRTDIDVDKLLSDKEALTQKYIEKSTSVVNAVLNNLYRKLDELVHSHPLMDEMDTDMPRGLWFMGGFTGRSLGHVLKPGDTQEHLLQHVKNAVRHLRGSERYTSVRSTTGLVYSLAQSWEKIKSAHRVVRDSLAVLIDLGTNTEFVSRVVNCCLRSSPQTAPPGLKCQYCQTEVVLKDLEYTLFAFTDRYFDLEGEEQLKGTWADSVTVSVFKSLVAYLRSSLVARRREKGKCDELHTFLEQATSHMNLLDNLKRHFKSMRVLWVRLRDRTAAVDELSMATIRFRLREPEETNPTNLAHIIERHELEQLHQKQIYDMMDGKEKLSRSLRQFNYLQHLESQPLNPESGNTELCPICQQPLGHNWVVMSCCHSFCIDCIRSLHNRGVQSVVGLPSDNRTMKCAVCRERTRRLNLSYVSSGKRIDPACQDIEVKGDYSSKILEVIRCLKTIEREEPDAKALVFSSWTGFLNVVAQALDANEISYRHLSGSKASTNYESSINSFRLTAGIEALLLPISSGANGLNLIEATHVLLLEPLLNPGKEAQAIGRVHRIGQTRPTFIHKFIMRHTIEEKIHLAMSAIPLSSSDDISVDYMPFTLGDLADMFDTGGT